MLKVIEVRVKVKAKFSGVRLANKIKHTVIKVIIPYYTFDLQNQCSLNLKGL